jgi:hypothetical protein
MLAQRLHRKVVHQLHLAELDHDQIHIARPGAVGQLLPGGQHGLETQARVRQVEPPEGGPHQRRTAVGAHADAQLAQFQPLRERDVALQVARGAVELARMVSSSRPTSVGSMAPRWRSSTGAPTLASSAWMLRDSAGWVRCTASAARLKLPCSTTAMRWRNWRSSINES